MKYVALGDYHCMWRWIWPQSLHISSTNQPSPSWTPPTTPFLQPLAYQPALSTPHTDNTPIFQPFTKHIYQDHFLLIWHHHNTNRVSWKHHQHHYHPSQPLQYPANLLHLYVTYSQIATSFHQEQRLTCLFPWICSYKRAYALIDMI